MIQCLQSPDVMTRGVALKALAQLGHCAYRELCELIVKDAWKQVAKSRSSRFRTSLPIAWSFASTHWRACA